MASLLGIKRARFSDGAAPAAAAEAGAGLSAAATTKRRRIKAQLHNGLTASGAVLAVVRARVAVSAQASAKAGLIAGRRAVSIGRVTGGHAASLAQAAAGRAASASATGLRLALEAGSGATKAAASMAKKGCLGKRAVALAPAAPVVVEASACKEAPKGGPADAVAPLLAALPTPGRRRSTAAGPRGAAPEAAVAAEPPAAAAAAASEERAEPREPVHERPAADVVAAAEEDVMLAELHAVAEGIAQEEYVFAQAPAEDVYMEPEPELDASTDGELLGEMDDELDGPEADSSPHDASIHSCPDVAAQDEPAEDLTGQL